MKRYPLEILCGLAAGALFTALLAVFLSFGGEKSGLVLFIDDGRAISVLGNTTALYGTLLVLGLIIGTNYLIARILWHKNRLFSYFLSGTALITALLIAFYIFGIIVRN